MQKSLHELKIEDYSYSLPDDRIAKYPLSERDKSNLLIYRNNQIGHTNFYDIIKFLPEHSTLVFNNTKVIQARLGFYKTTGANIEVFCLEPHNPADYQLAFTQKHKVEWKCLIGNLKKWKTGKLTKKIRIKQIEICIEIEKKEVVNDAHVIAFEWFYDEKYTITFDDILQLEGQTPIPPYLNRTSEESDKIRYQTVYSKHNGSVAAPTAGLHFTPEILTQLKEKNINTVELTLHVGAGTFKPVKSQRVKEHQMHAESFFVSPENLVKIKNAKNIIAVGTTSVRMLESIYWFGIKAVKNKLTPQNHTIKQWEVYENTLDISKNDALNSLHKYLINNQIEQFEASTQIMIVPGYRFKVVKGMITNFHQPKSTLLLLISAFVGNNWKKIYNYALENQFRFLSYGDSSLLLP